MLESTANQVTVMGRGAHAWRAIMSQARAFQPRNFSHGVRCNRGGDIKANSMTCANMLLSCYVNARSRLFMGGGKPNCLNWLECKSWTQGCVREPSALTSQPKVIGCFRMQSTDGTSKATPMHSVMLPDG